MSVDLTAARYVPTIFLRRSELMAVKNLPEGAKDRLAPIFCLKPWATAKLLTAAMDKIEDAYPNRPYFLDIDPFYNKQANRQAQEEFQELIDDDGGVTNWINFFQNYPNAHPCLQVRNRDADDVEMQIASFTSMERTFLVRLEYPQRYTDLIDLICETDHSNFGFVLDGGWSRDFLSRSVWVDSLTKRIVELRGGDVPIITSGSSFPASFSNFDIGDSATLFERRLFDQIRAQNNQARLIYGDWASSRSPTESGGGGVIPPRIDLATDGDWRIFRSQGNNEDFPFLARLAQSSASYPRGLNIWATYMIDATALSDANGINNLGTATAVRINMHLYRQINFGSFDPNVDTDDEYIE